MRCAFFWKKPKYEFRVGWAQGSLNFIFSVTSVNLKYGDIFFFPNKLKFHDSSNCTKLLIREQKIIHKSVLHINFTRLDVRIFYAFEELSEVANYISSIFNYNVQVFRNTRCNTKRWFKLIDESNIGSWKINEMLQPSIGTRKKWLKVKYSG